MYAGWTGGYAFKQDDDTAQLQDATYTDFVKFDSATIQELESSPKLSMGAWFF